MQTPIVVVPLDGSTFAESAIPACMRVASDIHAQIEFISVYDPDPIFAGWPLSADRYREWLEAYLTGLIERIADVSDVRASFTITTGAATAKVITEFAARRQADLVVMSTHGRGPVSRMWLGSVADWVVRHVTRPVMLVRPDPEIDTVRLEKAPPFRKILIPLDGSALAESVLDLAGRYASDDATHTLLRVVPPAPVLASPYLPHVVEETRRAMEIGRENAMEYLDRVQGRLRQDHLGTATTVVTDVAAAAGILSYAADHPVDLIAIATHGRRGLARMLMGSVADKVVRGAPTPVLVVRPPAMVSADPLAAEATAHHPAGV